MIALSATFVPVPPPDCVLLDVVVALPPPVVLFSFDELEDPPPNQPSYNIPPNFPPAIPPRIAPTGPTAAPIAPINAAPIALKADLAGGCLNTNTSKKNCNRAPMKGILLIILVNPLPTAPRSLNKLLPPTLIINLLNGLKRLLIKSLPRVLFRAF